MISHHPNVDDDIDPEARIWRYFDFPKFVSLAKRKALYFCRASLIGGPLEGSFTRALERDRGAILDSAPDERTRDHLHEVFRL